jgi:CIC family chloride channel protein
MLGGIFGILVTALAPQAAWMGVDDPAHVTGACVLLGMGAMFASVVRCPLTSLIMIFEMTRNYSLILPLMAGNMLSYYLARNLRRVSLYNALLLQDGITLRRMPSYQGAQDYQNLPVAAIMTHDVVCLDGTRGPGENLARLRTLDRKFHGYPVTSNGVFQSVIMHRELEQAARESPDKSLAELTDGQKTEWISPDTSIRDAARLMIARDYGQLPVCSPSDSGKLLGWITLNDIARQQNAVDLALERR